jgi:hypothetical protein
MRRARVKNLLGPAHVINRQLPLGQGEVLVVVLDFQLLGLVGCGLAGSLRALPLPGDQTKTHGGNEDDHG